MLIIDNEYDLQETVYLKTDPGQLPRIVHRIIVIREDLIQYALRAGSQESIHYKFELSKEPDFYLKLSR